MKDIKSFIDEEIANVTGDAVQMVEKPLGFKGDSFMGIPVCSVCDDDYIKLIQGRKKHSRWKNFITDTDVQTEVKKQFHKNKDGVVLKNTKGDMIMLKR